MQPLSVSLTKKTKYINVGISNRHLHVSERDKEILFGKGYTLTYIKSLSQKGQFAAKETVTLVGTKSKIEDVRILGPEREHTQVEISITDMYKLGVNAPIRDSGDIEGTPGLVIIGPKGMLKTSKGLICAKRHIHMTMEDARYFNVKDKQEVCVKIDGERGSILEKILIRIHESFVLELHLDTDEANAACLKNNDKVELMIKEY